MLSNFSNRIFELKSQDAFNQLALEIFRYQAENNPVYNEYVNLICKEISKIKHYSQIPFLPIEFFRTKDVITGNSAVQKIFRSSGTTGQLQSRHIVTDLSVYKNSAIRSFEQFYGDVSEFTFLALLPSYLERDDSSLVYMTNLFINRSNFKEDCGFFLDDLEDLITRLKKLSTDKSRKVLLLGVSFALLDLAEKIDFPLNEIIVMETGGMKGRRKEIIREELHEILCKKMQVKKIHSEYGMTELLTQSYSQGAGIYNCPPWMKVIIREMNDPLAFAEEGRSGGINIIDLANINSCSFIATQDVGKCFTDGSFEVSGRFDYSDTRGCNLLLT
jgi:hypothetical protein